MNTTIQNALLKRARELHRAEFDRETHRDELRDIAAAARKLAQRIEDSPARWDLEGAHDDAHGPHALQAELQRLRDLAQTAEDQAQAMTGKRLGALAFIAAAWLYVEAVLYGAPRPALYDWGPAVQAVRDLASEATGQEVNEETARKALAAALKTFDPTDPPPHIRDFLDWARDHI